MTTFQDGPAKEAKLSLGRAPVFLRVTEEKGKFDALDQIDDDPRPGEKLYAYILVEYHGGCFWDGRDEKGKRIGGFRVMATYRLFEPQPTDSEMRDTDWWRAWCERNRGAAAHLAPPE